LDSGGDDRRPCRAPNLMINVDEGQVITATNPVTGRVFVLNDVAKKILDLCDGSTPVPDIELQLLRSFHGSSPEQVRQDVREFLQACQEAQVVLLT
jgi:hypothetical protein